MNGRRKSDRFFRSSNVLRMIGLAGIVWGQFLPGYEMDLLGLKFHSNMVQVAGFILVFSPMVREILVKKVGDRENAS